MPRWRRFLEDEDDDGKVLNETLPFHLASVIQPAINYPPTKLIIFHTLLRQIFILFENRFDD